MKRKSIIAATLALSVIGTGARAHGQQDTRRNKETRMIQGGKANG